MLKKCPRVMTKKVNETPIIKFSKITDEKMLNTFISEKIVDKINTPAGKKVIINESRNANASSQS